MVVGDLTLAADVVVLGSGPAGYTAAVRAAELGKYVALVGSDPLARAGLADEARFRALMRAARWTSGARRLRDLGAATGSPAVDLRLVQTWVDQQIEASARPRRDRLRGHDLEIVPGHARFTTGREVWTEHESGAHRIGFEHCVIATGSRLPPFLGVLADGVEPISVASALRLERLPTTINVFGSDPRAYELATMFRLFGAEVSLELADAAGVLGGASTRIVETLHRRLADAGVAVTTHPGPVFQRPEWFDRAMVSARAQSSGGGMDLARAGLSLDDQGVIVVNSRLTTSNPRIFAVGAAIDRTMLTEIAIAQGRIAAEALAGLPVEFAPRAIPRIIWSEPEVALAGVQLADAEAAGYQAVARFAAVDELGLGLVAADTGHGLVELVAEAATDVLIGAAAVGEGASQIIGEAALAIEMGATLTDLAETLHGQFGLAGAIAAAARI